MRANRVLAAENRRYEKLAHQAGIAAALDSARPGPAAACPPSDVADRIVPWFEIFEGDLVLYNGQMHQVQQVWPLLVRSEFGVRLLREGETQDVSVDSNSLVAVRRYVTGEEAGTDG